MIVLVCLLGVFVLFVVFLFFCFFLSFLYIRTVFFMKWKVVHTFRLASMFLL